MKLMRLAMCVAVFALIGGIAVSEDMDIRALQQKLAAQEARLNDLQSKMSYSRGGGEAEGVVSLRKNATVTIGGTVNTRYHYRDAEVKSKLAPATGNQISADRRRVEDYKHGDLKIADAKLEFKIDVNDYFDAYVKLDLQDGVGRNNVSGIAQNYWVRWKNVCNSGFGLLVGRDSLKFGDGQPIGVLDSFLKDSAGEANNITGGKAFVNAANNYGDGMFAYGSMLPAHSTYNWTRTTQITPYWESQDGKFKAELSFVQALERQTGITGTNDMWYTDNSGTRNYRSINYGAGSMSGRITWKPIDGLKVVASAVNFYARNSANKNWAPAANRGADGRNYGIDNTSNSTATNLAFQYRPCFFNKLNIWASWTHGWNEAWVDNMDSDTIQYGAMYDITDQFTFFAMGENIRVKNKQSDTWHKATGWAVYTGLKYKLPYGVYTEAGWRHENISYKDRGGDKHTKYKADILYAHLGFDF